MSTKTDWEKWGTNEPYYAVLTSDQFLSGVLNNQVMESFFESGNKHVEMVISTIREKLDAQYSPNRVLDFGCGVGRLLIPFSKKFSYAVGVDISNSMLEEASKNCQKFGADNVDLVISDDELGFIDDDFDLIHSSLVLQHINPRYGMRIIEKMAKQVKPGGYLALQLYYGCNAPSLIRTIVKLRYSFPFINCIRNIYRKRPLFEPMIQLYIYSLSDVYKVLFNNDCIEMHTKLNHCGKGEFDSIFIFAKKITRC